MRYTANEPHRCTSLIAEMHQFHSSHARPSDWPIAIYDSSWWYAPAWQWKEPAMSGEKCCLNNKKVALPSNNNNNNNNKVLQWAAKKKHIAKMLWPMQVGGGCGNAWRQFVQAADLNFPATYILTRTQTTEGFVNANKRDFVLQCLNHRSKRPRLHNKHISRRKINTTKGASSQHNDKKIA